MGGHNYDSQDCASIAASRGNNSTGVKLITRPRDAINTPSKTRRGMLKAYFYLHAIK